MTGWFWGGWFFLAQWESPVKADAAGRQRKGLPNWSRAKAGGDFGGGGSFN